MGTIVAIRVLDVGADGKMIDSGRLPSKRKRPVERSEM
jgi:hypothetical protein